MATGFPARIRAAVPRRQVHADKVQARAESRDPDPVLRRARASACRTGRPVWSTISKRYEEASARPVRSGCSISSRPAGAPVPAPLLRRAVRETATAGPRGRTKRIATTTTSRPQATPPAPETRPGISTRVVSAALSSRRHLPRGHLHGEHESRRSPGAGSGSPRRSAGVPRSRAVSSGELAPIEYLSRSSASA